MRSATCVRCCSLVINATAKVSLCDHNLMRGPSCMNSVFDLHAAIQM
jgi:hypothetical protein